jgi:hypothetical protein
MGLMDFGTTKIKSKGTGAFSFGSKKTKGTGAFSFGQPTKTTRTKPRKKKLKPMLKPFKVKPTYKHFTFYKRKGKWIARKKTIIQKKNKKLLNEKQYKKYAGWLIRPIERR